jgi:RNA polymerase sigma factor (sigma-70 family)
VYTVGDGADPLHLGMMTSSQSGALEERFDRLYRVEYERLWRAVYAFARNSEVASDSVAEAFAQCLRRGDQVRDPRAWVWRAAFAIARGTLADRARWVRFPSEEPGPSESGAGRVMTALAQLSEKQRAVILLRHYAGYRSREVAELLGMAPATVRVHLARGRRNLRRALEEDDERDRT